MGILSVVLLVFFVIIAILLVLLVLIQNDEGGGLGGIFAGGADTAFGSRSGNVLTKATTVLGSLFLVISLGLALLSRTPGGTGVVEEAIKASTEENANYWEEIINPTEKNPLEDNVFVFDGENDYGEDHSGHDH